MLIYPMRSTVVSLPAKGRCSSSIRRKGRGADARQRYQAIDTRHEVVPSSTRWISRRQAGKGQPADRGRSGSMHRTPKISARPARSAGGAGSDRDPGAAAARRAAAPLKACWSTPGMIHYLGVVALFRVKDGGFRKGMRIRLMGRGRLLRGRSVGCSRRSGSRGRASAPAKSAFSTGFDQGSGRHPRRRHHHRRQEAVRRGAARLPSGGAGGVLRTVSRGRRQFRGFLRAAMGKLRLNDASLTYDRRPRRPSVSVSAAAFSASCTWMVHRGASAAGVRPRADRYGPLGGV